MYERLGYKAVGEVHLDGVYEYSDEQEKQGKYEDLVEDNPRNYNPGGFETSRKISKERWTILIIIFWYDWIENIELIGRAADQSSMG